MAEAAVAYVLGKLDILLNKAHELNDWRGQFEQMHKELRLIHALLRAADSKHNRNELVAEWLNMVREIANRIASVIDTFRYYELEDIIHKLNQLYQFRPDLGIMDLGALDDVDDSALLSDKVYDPDVVGLEDEKRKILEQLLDINISRRTVLSIVGTGGLGKTTLAQKVYKSAELKGQFDCHTWLFISQEFNLNDLLRKILYSIEPQEKEKNPPVRDENLQVKLKSSLSGKRYLIVLDDVWTIDLWEQLKIALPDTNNASRVIITSRLIDVANAADCNTEPYRLCYLNDDEGLALLCRTACQHIQPENYPRDLLEVAKRLTKKCGGLPLALVVLGGILTRIERKYTAWSTLEETMDWHSEDGMKCSQVLAMSYEDLPYDLKPCFLYFAAFPEDYVISGKHVTKMWIAEGFIHEDGARTMEERAEAYLEELVQRCLIQVTEKSWNGCCKYGIMHILLRDLAIHEANENNFFTVLPKAKEYVNELAPTKPRRAALQFATLSHNDVYLENTRSILCFGSDIGFRKISSNDRGFALLNYSGFRLLRVLTIEFVDMRNFASLVGLIHLRYMGFRYCTIRQEIFQNISYYNLETIDLKGSCIEGETTEWSDVVIPILRHVYGYKKLERIFPLKWDHLTNLQTLKSVGQEQVPSLECCINLRTLGISYLKDHEMTLSPPKEWQTLKGVLKRTEQLVSLSIVATSDGGYLVPFGGTKDLPCHEKIQSLRLNGKLGRLHEDPIVRSVLTIEMFPTNLTKLTLEESRLQEDPMPIFERLQSLRMLRLRRYSYEGTELICSTGGFPNLEKLELKELPKLRHWDIKEGAMPILSHLKIDQCIEHHALAELQNVRTLQELLVNHPSDKLQQHMQGEDRYKIKHIPFVLITTNLGARLVVSEEKRDLTFRRTRPSVSVDDAEVVGLEDDSDDARKQVEELFQLTEQQDPGTQSVGYIAEYYPELQDATNNQRDDRTTYTAEERPAHQFQLNQEGTNKTAPAIGIDLGTTYSCVAVWQNNRVEIIANDQGNRTTPSCVAFTENERLAGDSAKNQTDMNPTNTIFEEIGLQRELSETQTLREKLISERDEAKRLTQQLMSERDDATKLSEVAQKRLMSERDDARKLSEAAQKQLMSEREDATKLSEATKKLTEQLMSERDDAKRLSETIQKQLMFERDDARKLLEMTQKQLMSERDDAKKHSEAAQKLTEQLMSEKDDAIKQVEELRWLIEQQTPCRKCVGCFIGYSYSELQHATDNFHESFKLGEGGFGKVYKGILHNTTIAIKILNGGSSQGEKEFHQEVEVLSKLQHPNLVKLIGACAEIHALIYEYLPNGSLEDRLRCKNNTLPLSWQARVRIAFEICSALSFLHSSKPHGIVHGDLKPDNVLLDLNNVSKLSDFGLCRQLNLTTNASRPFHYMNCPKRTFGYIDPEYFTTGTMTHQNDVYSFGIMLLQLVTCKDPWGIRQSVEEEHRKGTLKELIDASAGPWPFKEAEKMTSLGLRCSDTMRINRPDLLTVVWKEMKSMADVASASQSSSWAASLFRH